jgi:single-stranded-DNA-specific exonuclease
MIESHGIQHNFVQFVKEGKYSLIITVDNGIVSFEGADDLARLHNDLIITDHHLLAEETLPHAYAVINPKRSDSLYPYRMAAGVGVTLCLIRYLAKLLNLTVPANHYFWAAVGSLADKVPLTGVNRIIVRYVMDHFEEIKDETVHFLLRHVGEPLTCSEKLNFMHYTARFFTFGREEGGNHLMLRFLLAGGKEKQEFFSILDSEKQQQEKHVREVQSLVNTLITGHTGLAFIYYDDADQIPYPLLGLAANQVVSALHIPTVFLKNKQDYIVCEARCEDGFNLVEAFRFCKEHLIQFGGHVRAAGFSMEPEKINAFIDCFNQYLSQEEKQIRTHQYIPVTCSIQLADLTDTLWHRIEMLQPFGMENSEPIMLLEHVQASVDLEDFIVEWDGKEHKEVVFYDVLLQWKARNVLKIIDVRQSDTA